MADLEKKGWLARRLDVTRHEPWPVAFAVLLGVTAGLAPWDSGVFALFAFLILFCEASTVVALVCAVAFFGVSIACLDAKALEIGRSLNASPGETQQFVYSFPLVAFLGLERHRVVGGLVLAAGIAPVLAIVAYFVQRMVYTKTKAADRKERKKRAKREWQPNVKGRATDEVKDTLRPFKKWALLAVAVTLVQFLGSGIAGRWLLENEVAALVAEELGSCNSVRAESVEGSILGAHVHARNVVISAEHAQATIPDLEVQLDLIGLLRRKVVAKQVTIRGAHLVLERGIWPLPPRAASKEEDRNELLASRPRWSIGKGEIEELEVEWRADGAPRTVKIKTGELLDIGSRDRRAKFGVPELHLAGESFALDLVDGVAPATSRSAGN